MPRFLVKQYRDAYQMYEAVIEADSKEEAHALAEDDKCVWLEGDVIEYDDREIPLDEIERISDVPVCAHCGALKSMRNPTGHCDHLYWPDNLTPEAKRANGIDPEAK